MNLTNTCLPKMLAWSLALAGFHAVQLQADEPLKVGMIGLDTSHAIAFTRLLHSDNPEVGGGGAAKVIVAYSGGSADIPSSANRVAGYTDQMKNDFGVEIVDCIETLCSKVDVVMLESVDGRPHLEQVIPVILAKKNVFIDKPLAGSLQDAIAIDLLAKKHGVKWFSSSAYRYYQGMTDLMAEDVGIIKGAISYGPATIESHHPDLYWYGIHPTEALYTALGEGCVTVSRTHTEDTDVVTGVWSDGRVGTLRGLRNASTPHQVVLFGTKKVASQAGGGKYDPLVYEISRFLKTGEAPVPNSETLEIYTFMEAADESKRNDGAPVSMKAVYDKAHSAAVEDLKSRGLW